MGKCFNLMMCVLSMSSGMALAGATDQAPRAEELQTETAKKQDEKSYKLPPIDRATIEQWKDLRLGLFIHWGPVSQRPDWEIGWSRKDPRFFELKPGEKSNVAEYDNLWKTFNPVKFDAAKWIEMVKQNGFSYSVFVSKHHDGFSMFDTALSDYKITKTPFGRDPLAELARECHKQGVGLGIYYSPMDWWNPDQTTDQRSCAEKKAAGVKNPMYTPATDKYREHLHGQVRELCTRYGEVMEMWFDGGSTSSDDNGSDKLVSMVRQLQPKAMINGRAYDKGRGDFETPERRIGRYNTKRAWEMCETLANGWSYRNDAPKEFRRLLQDLVWSATGDGNFLVNMGPMADGTFDPRHVARFEELGAWLKTYGQTVKGTRGGPFPAASYGGSTWRDNHIYLHVMFPDNGPFTLPVIDRKIVKLTCLTQGKASLRQTAGPDRGAVISIDEKGPADQIDMILDLELDGSVDGMKISQIPQSVSFGKPCTASSNPGNASNVCNGKDQGWSPDKTDGAPCLEVDAGKPVMASCAYLSIDIGHKAGGPGDFEVQAKVGDQWQVIGKGSAIYERTWIRLTPVTAQVFRLRIVKPGEFTVHEFQLY